MDLSDIKGLGPAKQQTLRDAGISSVEDLAGLDLRRNVKVQGVTQDALRGLKQRARQALKAQGAAIPKAPYKKNSAAAEEAPPSTVSTPPAKKRGLISRLLARS